MTRLDLKNRSGTLAVAIAALAAASVFGADAAMAGADTTFNTALAQFTGFLEGSGGRIITVLSRRHGKVRAVARGVRRTSSRFGARIAWLYDARNRMSSVGAHCRATL